MKSFETMINTTDENIAEEIISQVASFYTLSSPDALYRPKGYFSIVHFMRGGFSDVQWNIKEMAEEGNKVAVLWNLTGTHNGEFMG